MFIPVGFCNVSWCFLTIGGQEAMTSMGFETKDPFNPGLALLEAQEAFETNLSPFVNDGWQGDVIRITVGTLDPSEPVVGELPTWEGGTAGSEGAPPQVASLIKKFTARGGRKGRGRMFLPAAPEGGIDAYGNFSNTQLADFQNGVDDFKTFFETTDNLGKLFLLHTDPLEDPDEIVGLAVAQQVATQRRRNRS